MSRLPQITGADLVRFLVERGLVIRNQESSHVTLKHPATGAIVTVPIHSGRVIGRGLLRRILRDAGITIEDYLRLR